MTQLVLSQGPESQVLGMLASKGGRTPISHSLWEGRSPTLWAAPGSIAKLSPVLKIRKINSFFIKSVNTGDHPNGQENLE